MKGVKLTTIICQTCGIEIIVNHPSCKRCKPCAAKFKKESNAARLPAWQAANRDKCCEYTRQYAKRHPEQYRKIVKETHKRQREKLRNDPEKTKEVKEYQANYFQRNKERMALRSKQWVKDHPEQAKASRNQRNHNRRAKVAQAEGKWEFKDFMELCQASDGHCYYCLQPCDKLTADHMTPLDRNGSNWIENIVPACGFCNSSKGTKTVIEHLYPYWRELTS